ncbi:hypothetical protein [Amorphus coralli]|uniref:hypothetical protein n=1 Tax=Amorphus coralli TaxID=340680 RepID=UPI00037B7B90|nr:hypothetical protein [Amorphus coralli]
MRRRAEIKGFQMHYPRETYEEARRRLSGGGRYLMEHLPERALPERLRPRDNRDAALMALGIGAAAVVLAGTWYLVSTEPKRRRLRRSARKAYRSVAG